MSSLNEHPTLNPAPETPGVDMPGSFPIPKQGVDIAPGVQGVASDAFKTAKEYAQFAAQGAQTAVQSAGGKVGEYLPTNVSSYICKFILSPYTCSDELHQLQSQMTSFPLKQHPIPQDLRGTNLLIKPFMSPPSRPRRITLHLIIPIR